MLHSLPIFTKELYEVAARKNTYILRVVYAVVLIAVFAWLMQTDTVSSTSLLSGLGAGAALYQKLIIAQFALILFVVPPLVANAVAGEKENNTIVFVLVIPAQTLEILLQKYAGRMLPVISLILISLPLFGTTLSMGGVTTRMVFAGTWNCILYALSVGALALAVSCYRDSTVRATIDTYVLLLIFAPSCLSPIAITASSNSYAAVGFSSFLAFVFIFVCFHTACDYFRKRALGAPLSPAEHEEKYSEDTPHRIFHCFRQRHGLPDITPVTWLESSNQKLNPRTFRELCMAIAAILIIGNLIGTRFGLPLQSSAKVFGFICLFALMNTQQALMRLKGNETLQTMRSLPFSGKEFLQQFARGRMWRTWRVFVVFVLALIPGVLFLTKDLFANSGSQGACFGLLTFALTVSATVLYLLFLNWLAILIGLVCRKSIFALGVCMAVVALFAIIIPLLYQPTPSLVGSPIVDPACLVPSAFFDYMYVLPTFILNGVASERLNITPLLLNGLLHHGVWIGLLLGLRALLLKNADRLLERAANLR